MGNFITQIMELKFAGGVTLSGVFLVVFWLYRLTMAYLRETREEYISRLNDAVLELERQKSINMRLRFRIHTLEYLQSHLNSTIPDDK